MDIQYIDVLWLHERFDDTPGSSPYSIEIETGGIDIDSVLVTNSVDSFMLTEEDGEFGLDVSGFSDFSSLLSAYPGGVWTFDFEGPGGTPTDSFTIDLGLITEVTDFIDITFPTNGATISTNPTITWLDCSLCGGDLIAGEAFDPVSDDDYDSFFGFAKTVTSWPPANLVPGPLEIEMILGDYLDGDRTTKSTPLDDEFSFLSGFESLNLVNATVVPEPGTAILLGLGLAGLGTRVRREPREGAAGTRS